MSGVHWQVIMGSAGRGCMHTCRDVASRADGEEGRHASEASHEVHMWLI